MLPNFFELNDWYFCSWRQLMDTVHWDEEPGQQFSWKVYCLVTRIKRFTIKDCPVILTVISNELRNGSINISWQLSQMNLEMVQ